MRHPPYFDSVAQGVDWLQGRRDESGSEEAIYGEALLDHHIQELHAALDKLAGRRPLDASLASSLSA